MLLPAAIVGANVTEAIGSAKAASAGFVARSSSRSATPRAAMSARGASVRSSPTRASTSAAMSGASFGSALSAKAGIDACPAVPRVVSVNRKTPFSAVQMP